MERSEILTGSSSGTNCVRSSRMPRLSCSKRLYPCPCRATKGHASRTGSAVGPQISPVSSSRTRIASPGGSLTGSLDQGVNWFCWLLTAQVQPEPDSDTKNPKEGLAITLIQGAGVHCRSPRIVTYSRPSSPNPPRPLKNSSSSCGAGMSPAGAPEGRGRGGLAAGSRRRRRTICSESVPCRERRTTRAAERRRSWSSAETRSRRRRKMPPTCSAPSRASAWRRDLTSVSRAWRRSCP